MTWTETVERYLSEGRTVSGGKGADTANAQRQQELQMQQQAYNDQRQRLAQLQSAFQKYTTQNIGYDPQQLALMNTAARANNAGMFNSAGAQVRSALAARGAGSGALPVGGDYVRGIAGLEGARASDLSSQLNNIQLQNAQQALINRFNAGNLLAGNAATLTGTQGVAGAGASSALGDYIRAKNTGFGASFMNAFGGALGGGLGSAITGGIGGGVSSLGGAFSRGFGQGAGYYG